MARELHVISMKRTGHHAIMLWIAGHFEGPVRHFNDVDGAPPIPLEATIAIRRSISCSHFMPRDCRRRPTVASNLNAPFSVTKT